MNDVSPVPQRLVTISIVGVLQDARVFYSYTSPIYGATFIDSPNCDISIDQPTHTLFVLDFAASMNGWEFVEILPNTDPSPLGWKLGLKGLSIMTTNNYDPLYPHHSYYIKYKNSITGKEMQHDPQEGNVNPPMH